MCYFILKEIPQIIIKFRFQSVDNPLLTYAEVAYILVQIKKLPITFTYVPH